MAKDNQILLLDILTVLQQTALTNSLASSSFLSFSYRMGKNERDQWSLKLAKRLYLQLANWLLTMSNSEVILRW